MGQTYTRAQQKQNDKNTVQRGASSRSGRAPEKVHFELENNRKRKSEEGKGDSAATHHAQIAQGGGGRRVRGLEGHPAWESQSVRRKKRFLTEGILIGKRNVREESEKEAPRGSVPAGGKDR